MNLSELAKLILRQGTDDWVPMAEVASLASGLLPNASQAEIRAAALAALNELQSKGFVRVGDVTRSGFVAWAESPAEALERVEREWISVGLPRLGDVGWLENTNAGREIGLSVPSRP
jgi:hypothetical protein